VVHVALDGRDQHPEVEMWTRKGHAGRGPVCRDEVEDHLRVLGVRDTGHDPREVPEHVGIRGHSARVRGEGNHGSRYGKTRRGRKIRSLAYRQARG
jgi:hypothetical protein